MFVFVSYCGVWDPGASAEAAKPKQKKEKKKKRAFYKLYFIPEKREVKSNPFELKYFDASACAGEE